MTGARQALLDRIGMRNTLLSTDRFGDFILSSQVYTNARDLARLGLLYAQGGVWNGERILSETWIDFVRQPAPATAERGNEYGGHWWLVPDDRTDVPTDAYSTAGNRGQFAIVVPSHDLRHRAPRPRLRTTGLRSLGLDAGSAEGRQEMTTVTSSPRSTSAAARSAPRRGKAGRFVAPVWSSSSVSAGSPYSTPS